MKNYNNSVDDGMTNSQMYLQKENDSELNKNQKPLLTSNLRDSEFYDNNSILFTLNKDKILYLDITEETDDGTWPEIKNWINFMENINQNESDAIIDFYFNEEWLINGTGEMINYEKKKINEFITEYKKLSENQKKYFLYLIKAENLREDQKSELPLIQFCSKFSIVVISCQRLKTLS